MPAINLDNVSFSYSSKPVLDRIDLHIGEGERACLIGPNGCGKTTLLRIASGDLAPEMGTARVSGLATELFQVPEAEQFDGSIGEYLDAALHPLRSIATHFYYVADRLEADANLVELGLEYDQLLAQMTSFDIWTLNARVAEVLAELGLSAFTDSGLNRHVGTLSPGQRVCLQLAATLILKPEVLILDEPTNHLDVEAIRFLTETINDWKGPVLMASHDRAFIEDTATVIYDMDTTVWNEVAKVDGTCETSSLYRCVGNYSNYLKEKIRAQKKHDELHDLQQGEKRRLAKHRQKSSRISRGGVRLATAEGKAKKYFADRAAATAERRMRNDDKRLESLISQEVRKPRIYNLSFEFEAPATRTGIAVSCRQAFVMHRLNAISFDISYGEHLLVAGANGSGKSTLLNWIYSGQPPAGTVASGIIARDESISLVPQHLPKENDAGFNTDVWRYGVGEVGKGILHPAMWSIPVPELSAGNQRRAQIATALASAPAILVIDEPTNYLDLASMEALERALLSWTGTLIITSHDRWLTDHWKGRRIDMR